MGRLPCCDKVGLKKGPWTPEEDQKLLAYIEKHGHGSWRALPAKAGLQRCGKSCRLRWANYLRPDIKRGKFSLQEEQTIIQLHALLGNRWSAIATHLPKRTDNEIKNYWNTHLKKRLAKMGIDPVTHKSRNDPLLSPAAAAPHSTKSVATLSHMAQWETARLEAEARLARQSRLRPPNPPPLPALPPPHSRCLDVLHAWQGQVGGGELESPTSTVSFAENAGGGGVAAAAGEVMDFAGSSSAEDPVKEEGREEEWKVDISYGSPGMDDVAVTVEGPWPGGDEGGGAAEESFVEGFTSLLLESNAGVAEDGGGDLCEDNKNYWNSILNLVNASPPPSEAPIF